MTIPVNDVHTVYRSSKRVTKKELDNLEDHLGAELPHGFRSFLSRFGHGWINDRIQFYCPGSRLILKQRKQVLERFEEQSDWIRFDGVKLDAEDLARSVQIGIETDDTHLLACPRFPGSVFHWSAGMIARYKTGIEILDPFGIDEFAYFVPLQPVPANRYVVCRSKRFGVSEVVEALEDLCPGVSRVIDVGRKRPAFWLFPTELGVKFHVFAGRKESLGNVYLKYRTSPKSVPQVDAVLDQVELQLRTRFKPASNTRIPV